MNEDADQSRIKNSPPTECHLWNKKGITENAVEAALALVKRYEDESHLVRSLFRCRECSHLYFYEWYEIVDWEEGDDKQYVTWIPVDDVASADALDKLSSIELLRYERIRFT